MKLIFNKPVDVSFTASQKKSVELFDNCFIDGKNKTIFCYSENRMTSQFFAFANLLESAICEIFALLNTSFLRIEDFLSLQKSDVEFWSICFTRSTISETIVNLDLKGGQK